MNSIGEEQWHRISKAFLFIEDHIGEPLHLNQVAKAAYYTPFHFHRVFRAVTGEPLNAYISRRRLEHCAARLLNEPNTPIVEVSERFGYSQPSAFARAFKKHFGLSPSEFRKEAPSKYSKIRILESKNGTPLTAFEPYFRNIETILKFLKMNATIEIKGMPPKHIMYIAHVGLMTQSEGYQKIMKWAGPKGLMNTPDLVMTSMYLDSAKVTAPQKIRVNIGILVPEPMKEEQGIHYLHHQPEKCAVGSFQLQLHEFEQAWVSMFVWVNEQGYKVKNMPPFELYYNDYREHPENKCIVDICIPIE
ncbi:MAG: AraC family transcriptional regulator [Aureisphaera sp.]